MIESGQLKTESDREVCPYCFGTGTEVVEGKGARVCECRRPALVAARLDKVPERYRGASVEALEARPALHFKQPAAVELIKSCPADSYVLSGEPGTGKTHLMWALYHRAAQDLNRRVVACSALQLIEQYREAFRPRAESDGPAPEVLVRPNDLQQTSTRWSLFLDDIDKPRMTEYVAEQIHALLDAAYVHNHQIVVTTNLRVREPDQLSAHFERADPRYGRAIVRRIVHEGNNLIEFF